MFDFSRFIGGEKTRPIEFIGLNSQQTAALKEQTYGLCNALMEHYPDVTKRGNGPNATLKCGIVWEHNGRRCTYAEIANAMDISEDSAYQSMNKFRKWVEAAFALKIEHKGDEIYLVTNETLGQKVERIDRSLQPLKKKLDGAVADIKSITQGGDTPILAGSMGKLVSAYASLEGVDLTSSALPEGSASEPVTPEIA